MIDFTWTTEPPKVAGWYLWRRTPGSGWRMLRRVYRSGRYLMTEPYPYPEVSHVGGEWAGPVPDPEESST